MSQLKKRGSFLLLFLLSCLAALTLHCKFEIFGGGFPDSPLLNGLNKLSNTFTSPDFGDLFVLLGVWLMLRSVWEREGKTDRGTLLFSLALSVALVTAISFKKFDSAAFLFANSYQMLVSVFCIGGFWVILYGGIRCLSFLLERAVHRKPGEFWRKYFLPVGFFVIFLGWLPWILMNYPGSGCPDSMLQLKEFFGVEPWGAGHPPLSTVLMGGLFTLGRSVADANFGFFLYCLLQTCVGAWVFSLSMKKLQSMGIPTGWCLAGVAFFAFTPLWGTYAQWVEKDLLYAEAALLQTVCMAEILRKRQCGGRDVALLTGASLGAVFLRNNGIYAVLPALILLSLWLKGKNRRRAAVAAVTVFAVYEGAVRLLYPALGIAGISMVESLSVPFQQTARYVCEHEGELTEYERQVIDDTFGFENMFGYDPEISDPIKIHYRGGDLKEYYGIWFRMFFKHPGTYVAAFVNKGYGYLAPVSQNIEAWVQEEYYDYMEEIGLYHVFDVKAAYVLGQIWYLSMNLPLVKYLCTPGLYTWIVAVLVFLLARRRRMGALILFVPSVMNILVCLASPLSGAIRYELPTVASAPFLIGWACLFIRGGTEGKQG